MIESVIALFVEDHKMRPLSLTSSDVTELHARKLRHQTKQHRHTDRQTDTR